MSRASSRSESVADRLSDSQWSPSSAGFVSPILFTLLIAHWYSPQLTILHYGSNSSIYPFFAFDSNVDPYNYRLTATASLVIWATELGSSFIARVVIWWCYKMDVTNVSSPLGVSVKRKRSPCPLDSRSSAWTSSESM